MTRKQYRAGINPVALALRNAGKLPEHERAQILAPVQHSLARLCEGVAAYEDWAALASACNVGLAIERQGVVRGLREHLHSTELTLQAIRHRARDDAGRFPYALHLQEIEQLRTFVTIHEFQLSQLSRGEYNEAVDRAIGEVRSTGGKVFRDMAAARQEALQL